MKRGLILTAVAFLALLFAAAGGGRSHGVAHADPGASGTEAPFHGNAYTTFNFYMKGLNPTQPVTLQEWGPGDTSWWIIGGLQWQPNLDGSLTVSFTPNDMFPLPIADGMRQVQFCQTTCLNFFIRTGDDQTFITSGLPARLCSLTSSPDWNGGLVYQGSQEGLTFDELANYCGTNPLGVPAAREVGGSPWGPWSGGQFPFGGMPSWNGTNWTYGSFLP